MSELTRMRAEVIEQNAEIERQIGRVADYMDALICRDAFIERQDAKLAEARREIEQVREAANASIAESADIAAEARRASPDDLRALDWTVAAHNDYMQRGELHTFWLVTKSGRAIKGEACGPTRDGDSLDQIRAQIGEELSGG